jgi:hypothetical protein
VKVMASGKENFSGGGHESFGLAVRGGARLRGVGFVGGGAGAA